MLLRAFGEEHSVKKSRRCIYGFKLGDDLLLKVFQCWCVANCFRLSCGFVANIPGLVSACCITYCRCSLQLSDLPSIANASLIVSSGHAALGLPGPQYSNL